MPLEGLRDERDVDQGWLGAFDVLNSQAAELDAEASLEASHKQHAVVAFVCGAQVDQAGTWLLALVALDIRCVLIW